MSNVKRYSLPIVLGVIAATLFVVGILAVTVWRPPQEVVATGSTDKPFTMTRAGVLPLYADEVNIQAVGEPDELVWVAVGSPDDIAAWLQDQPYDEVIGLSDLTTLKFVQRGENLLPQSPEEGAEEGEVQSVEDAQSADESQSPESQSADIEDAIVDDTANPLQSDMWTAVKYGRGSVSLHFSGDDMDMSILAATDGVGPAPTLTFTWETPQSNGLATASFTSAIIAALFALASAGFIRARTSREKQSVATTPQAQLVETVESGEVEEDDGETEETEVTVEENASDARFSETVTTDSGMMNLSALQGGGAFPTRKALRDAYQRGVDSLVVEGREFDTASAFDQDPEGLKRARAEREKNIRKQNDTKGGTE